MAAHCGAKARSGAPCKGHAMANGRCRMHGGKSTGPKNQTHNTNALTHGLYADYLSESEILASKSLKLGSVDAELRLMRVRVARALAAENAAAGKPELEEVLERIDGGEAVSAREERKSRVRDYNAAIDRMLGRIESLERTRLHLRADLGLGPEDTDADSLTPTDPDEPTPADPIR